MLSKTYTKYIQSLHHKKGRDADNRFIAEGEKVVMELLRSGKFECDQVLATEGWMKENEAQLRKIYDGPIQSIAVHELEKVSALNTSNEVLAVYKKSVRSNPVFKGRVVLALDTIQDPGNLGTIIRIADWFGINDIICSPHCVEVYNPKVVQSTMGSLGRVNVTYASIHELLSQQQNISSYAATLHGKSLNKIGELKEGIIIIGNESKGISAALLGLTTQQITIPKIGEAESLNAAVATGIILSHIVTQNLKI